MSTDQPLFNSEGDAHPSLEWLVARRDRAWADLCALLDGIESLDDRTERAARLEQSGFMLGYYRDCERAVAESRLEASEGDLARLRDENMRLSALLDGVGLCREHFPTVERGWLPCFRCREIASAPVQPLEGGEK